jgi:hypothetical protein
MQAPILDSNADATLSGRTIHRNEENFHRPRTDATQPEPWPRMLVRSWAAGAKRNAQQNACSEGMVRRQHFSCRFISGRTDGKVISETDDSREDLPRMPVISSDLCEFAIGESCGRLMHTPARKKLVESWRCASPLQFAASVPQRHQLNANLNQPPCQRQHAVTTSAARGTPLLVHVVPVRFTG